jgi:hypothetical protein
MNFSKEASKLLTNKYFLYFTVFLAATNILGYLVTNKFNAIVFFALIGLLTHQFSKNMAVVLLVAVLATNFLMANKMVREGLENQDATALQKAADADPQIASAVPIVKNSSSNEEAIAKANAADKANAATNTSTNATTNATTNANMSTEKVEDINNPELNKTMDSDAPEGVGEKLSNNKKASPSAGKASRLDYAATIEESYKNLDQILGSDALQNLSKDTHNLMEKQTKLFETMNNMVPVLNGAQDLLKKFDIGSLSDSLKAIAPLGASAMK